MADENEDIRQEEPRLPGAQLRTERERRGLTVQQVASELHVDRRVVQALEEDNFDALGAPIFVKGHLRNYARLIGLDPAAITADYEAAQQPSDPALVAQRSEGPRMEHHEPRAWVGWLGWLLVVVLGLGLAGWWYYQQEGGAEFDADALIGRDVTPRTSEPPIIVAREAADEPSVTNAEEDEVATDEAVTGETTDETADETADEPRVTESETVRRATPREQPREQVQAPATVSRPAARTAAQPLVLEFSEESWVEVYDAEGRPILYDLVRAGSRREINATGELRVFLGNASGVDIVVRGERFSHQRFRRSDDTARFTLNVPE